MGIAPNIVIIQKQSLADVLTNFTGKHLWNILKLSFF